MTREDGPSHDLQHIALLRCIFVLAFRRRRDHNSYVSIRQMRKSAFRRRAAFTMQVLYCASRWRRRCLMGSRDLQQCIIVFAQQGVISSTESLSNPIRDALIRMRRPRSASAYRGASSCHVPPSSRTRTKAVPRRRSLPVAVTRLAISACRPCRHLWNTAAIRARHRGR